MKRIFIVTLVLGVGLISLALSSSTHPTHYSLDPDDCLDDLEVPKRFTPDGNDTNDVFMINWPCNPESFEIQIFDRFGNKVFNDKKGNVEWNGLNLENRPCESGVYAWKLAYMYHMKYVERNGQVLLLR